MRGIIVKYNFNLIILIEAKQCDGGIIAPAHFRKAGNISEQQSTVKAAHNAAVSCAGNGFTVIFGSDPFHGIPYSFVGMPHRLAALGRIQAVQRRRNIAVSGGTGSGKTTLLNALSACIPPTERIITIEDSAELRFTTHPHVIRLEARPKNIEGFGEVTIKDLVINALRMRPDRIVVGECRGSEALDMLQAMNTGHDGSLTTLHANAPKEAISRLTTMVRYGVDLPVEVIELQIAEALDLVVQTNRDPAGKRYITEIVGYSYNAAEKRCETKSYFKRAFWHDQGTWRAFPSWLDTLPEFALATEEEVERWKQRASSAA